ncbi:uncharacterized protein Z518_09225 [Rhinocladiella mackenziei CBS 650.93]|uniref:Alcohol acetyltransferase n=1 Tax=Rhinocladiella mackenziei CBS 650.93 TaxID=1442369 RepID=A0A0D2I6T0_9EURO|nr:uncharacterized protein Z518_09225 [Rhinocladiella mackenziei CBS 650.93]KIX01499.1 hypothetical protein Z518_09225 [Rhinocladiella mackenziei CBS 650.93]
MESNAARLCKLRALGVVEKYMTARSDLGIYNNVAVTAWYTYTRTSSMSYGNVNLRTALFNAIATVISQHPILSAIPLGTNTLTPYFAHLPSIDLNQVITFIRIPNLYVHSEGEDKSSHGRSPALDRFIQEQHNRPFAYTQPLSPFWRVYILTDENEDEHTSDESKGQFVLSFFFHHCIADTKSALVFHQSVENALAHPNRESQENSDGIVRTMEMDLLPPLDDFLDKGSPSLITRSMDQEQHAQPQSSSTNTNTWTGPAQVVPVTTKFRSLRASSITSSKLLETGKKRGLSLTSTLQSMLAAALFECLPPQYTSIKIDCAVSLRQWLPTPVTETSMGTFVDIFGETYSRESEQATFSWDDARRTQRAISNVMQRRKGDELWKTLMQVENGDLKAWLQGKLGHSRVCAMELSNVGKLPKPASPTRESKGYEYQIEGLLFSQSAGACSAAIKVSAVTGRDGCLTLGFSWQEGVVDDKMVERVICELERIVKETLQESEQGDRRKPLLTTN